MSKYKEGNSSKEQNIVLRTEITEPRLVSTLILIRDTYGLSVKEVVQTALVEYIKKNYTFKKIGAEE